MWLRVWIARGRPKSGHVFELKQRSKLHFKRYLRSVCYKGSEFPKDAAQWRRVISSIKMNCYTDSGVCISSDAWLKHYKGIFDVNNVHYLFADLYSKLSPPNVQQKHVIPVSLAAVLNGVNNSNQKAWTLMIFV